MIMFQFHDDIVQVGHEFPHRGFCPAAHAHGNPHGDSRHDVGQHVLPAEQAYKVIHGQGLDEHLPGRQGFAHFPGRELHGGVGSRRPDIDHHQYQGGGKHAGDDEGEYQAAQDLAKTFQVQHTPHGGSNGYKDHGHHNGEHQVDENIPQGFQDRCLFPEDNPDDGSQDDTAQEDQRKPVAFPQLLLGHDRFPLTFSDRLRLLSAAAWLFPR